MKYLISCNSIYDLRDIKAILFKGNTQIIERGKAGRQKMLFRYLLIKRVDKKINLQDYSHPLFQLMIQDPIPRVVILVVTIQ